MKALVPVALPERGGAGFLAWWLAELRAFVPDRLRRRRAPNRCIVILTEGNVVDAWQRRGNHLTPLGRVYLADGEHSDPTLLRRLARRSEPLWLLIPASEEILAHDSLPASAERDLRAIMRHRVEVLTPWPADAVHSDARVTRRRPDGMLEIGLAVVGRETVASRIAALAQLKIVPSGVDLADAETGLPCGFDLCGGARLTRSGKIRLWAFGICAAAAVLVLGGWGGSTAWQLEQQLAVKRRHAEGLEQRFADLPRLRERLDNKRRRAGFVAERRREAVSATVVLEVLSRILPDSVWLTELQLEERQVSIAGYTTDAAQVLPLVEASGHFAEVRFKAPSTRVTLRSDGGGERSVERFALAATVSPLLEPAL